MKIFEILDSDSSFVRQIKTEANQAQHVFYNRGENSKVSDVILAAEQLLNLAKYSEFYTDTYRILSLSTRFIKTGLFSPLTLTEGEFIYTKPGLSTNRRFNAVKQDTNGIYYENAFIITPVEWYYVNDNKSYTEPKLSNNYQEIDNNPNRVFLLTGGLITNIFFDKAYIRDRHIKRKRWVPDNACSINCCQVVLDDKYINVIQTNTAIFKTLNNNYYLNLQEDTNEYLKEFDVTNKISIYELFGKRSTF